MNNRIDYMDLKRQYKKYKSEFMDAIEQVCEETAFSGGKFAERFEKDFAHYIGTSYCAAVNSGTSALHMAMLALNIGPGDEVIVPANTFIASAWGVMYTGATPVFVDCTDDTWVIDATKLEEKVTKNTKAIVGVHLYGQPFDVDAIKKIAHKHQLALIEDCAQAHGAKYKGKKVGGFGDVGCFSFYPGKNLGAFGEGGAITTDSKSLCDMINIYKNHGAEKRYYHDYIGYNMRMDGIQGAILSQKLKYLDSWNQRRKEIAQRYKNEIRNENIKFQKVTPDTEPVYHLMEVQVDNRDVFMEYMENRNIYCSCHYPVPCHLQKVFAYLGYKEGDLPIAEALASHCVSLPMFPELRDDEVDAVILACNNYR